jgi:hypothetical protein
MAGCDGFGDSASMPGDPTYGELVRNESRAVTRGVTMLVLSLSVALSGLVLASPASAVTSTIDYTLDGADPTMTTPLGTDSTGPCVDDATAGTYSYEVVRFKPTVSGSYTIAEDAGSADGRLGLYSGAFTPASQLTGCIAFVDENTSSPFSVSLTAGVTYTMVRSAGVSGGSGTYQFDVDGPGVLTVLTATATTLTTSPNPSELSKTTTLRAVVAGGTTPTGTVQFRDGSAYLGSAALVGGVARLSIKSLKVGNHTLSAAYLGDSTHDVSGDFAAHTVKYGPKPKVKLRISDKTPYFGQKVRLTWVAKRADKVRASGAWHGKRPKKGSRIVKIKKVGRNVFRLTAKNINGKDVAEVKVWAIRAPKQLTVSVSDPALEAGSLVRVRADGLDPQERFKIFLDDDVLAKGRADRRGDVSRLVRIPRTFKDGGYVLSVRGGNETRVGFLDVLVLRPKQLNVDVAKQLVRVGRDQTVSVTGLIEGESVTLTYLGQVLVQGLADAQGEFEYTFVVGEETGTKTVEVEGGLASRVGQASFEVAKPRGRYTG